ncbi:hypothetical protein Zmor_019223 [Zophobas morio]|uniref:Uncharacterized protein n=1 Tax=Zophobas morio TaxID=2755281 RepID=A0AA38I5I7_9CUCU|nr:hypothetical protein Zmor_019223 [Zophobas morio]
MRCRLFREIIPERKKEDVARCSCRHLHRGLLRGAREQASRSPRGPHTSIWPPLPYVPVVRGGAHRWRQMQQPEGLGVGVRRQSDPGLSCYRNYRKITKKCEENAVKMKIIKYTGCSI